MKRLNKAIALLLTVIIVMSGSLYPAVSVFAMADNGPIPALDYEKSVNSGNYSLKAKVLSNNEGTSVSIEEKAVINQTGLQPSTASNELSDNIQSAAVPTASNNNAMASETAQMLLPHDSRYKGTGGTIRGTYKHT
jgi:uncharacterized membrane protein